MRNAVLGKNHSEETKEKLINIQSNRTKLPVSGFKIGVKNIERGKSFLYDFLRIAGK